jgi:hypothetical protein
MNSKQWIDQAIKKPAKFEPQESKNKRADKRARLAEMLLKMRKGKG